MARGKFPLEHWNNYENCKAEAAKFTTQSQFHSKSRAAYNAIIRNGWFEELCGSMPRVIKHYMPQSEVPYVSEVPELMKMWSKEDNRVGLASQIKATNSKVEPKWVCPECGRIFKRFVNLVYKGSVLCKTCSSRKNAHDYIKETILEKGSLVDNYPELLDYWDYDLNDQNNIKKPSEYLWGSNVEVSWKCPHCNHKWKDTIIARTHAKFPCPNCLRNNWSSFVFGDEPISKTHPQLLDFWDPANSLSPDVITAHDSNSSITWSCPVGHTWTSTPEYFVNVNHCKCPKCQKEMQTSFPEQAIYYYLSQSVYAINRYIIKKIEIDIYFPTLNIGIEYDGKYYHRGKKAQQREEKKELELKKNGIRLIRIKERDTHHNLFEHDTIFVENDKESELESVIRYIFEYLSISLPDQGIDIERDRISIYEQYMSQVKENSIAVVYPSLLEEWDYEKNGKLNPEYFSCKSSKRVYWKCKNGHSWDAVISSRSKNGCPYCAGVKFIPGQTDLASVRPDLLEEWDYAENSKLGIYPDQVSCGNKSKVHWICKKCNNHWPAPIYCRARMNHGCDECAKSKRLNTRHKTLICKKGSFAQNYPNLLLDWDYTKNIGIDPEAIPCHLRTTVYWKCHVCGYVWPTTVDGRVGKKSGCPDCNRRSISRRQRLKAVEKNGSIVETHPHLLLDWDYQNNEIPPEELCPGSHMRVNWLCHVCGHSWPVAVYKRALLSHRCPQCKEIGEKEQ